MESCDLLPSERITGDETRKNIIRSYHAHCSDQEKLHTSAPAPRKYIITAVEDDGPIRSNAVGATDLPLA